MRILFLNYEYPPLGGGAGNATRYLLAEYARMDDVGVDLVTSGLGERYYIERVGTNVTIHFVPIGKDDTTLNFQTQAELLRYTWKGYLFARKLCKEQKFDVCHAFFAVPCGAMALLLKWEFKLPFVVSQRGADVPGYSERFTKLYTVITPLIRFVWKSAARVVANSEDLKALAKKTAPNEHIDIIRNGVDTKIFAPAQKKKTGGTFTILCASRLSRRKGFRYAIDAVHALHKKGANIKMTIAGGEGNAMEELKSQVKKRQLGDVVTFTGHYTRQQAPGIYKKADVFVMPSLNEGMSNNLLEALASGLPLITTKTGGAEALVTSGENGFHVPMQDAHAIADALEQLIADRELCATMGWHSRARAENLSWQNVAADYHALYQQIAQS